MLNFCTRNLGLRNRKSVKDNKRASGKSRILFKKVLTLLRFPYLHTNNALVSKALNLR
ncbi:hypothetical protein SAMN05216326_13611 [Nitrosomonas marina]|uniref:Uncharacterized protein n=1 Tax=Nitrosomonas marina TaxID=917 RepID=A0A1I0FBJ3_9PROT|nr:hypothetical protein SAMN05216326_13611 [Nitrosomonas marina]